MDASQPGTMTVHWSDQKNYFPEIQSKTSKVSAGHNVFSFLFWSWNDVKQIRLEPLDRRAQMTLNHIVIRTLGYSQVIYNKDSHFKEFKHAQGFAQFESKDDRLFMTTANDHAGFEFDVNYQGFKAKELVYLELLNFLYLVAFLFVLSRFRRLRIPYALVILCCLSVYFAFKLNNPRALIDIEMESAHNGEMAISWLDHADASHEIKVSRLTISPTRKTYRVRLDELQDINSIHVEFPDFQGRGRIHRIQISEIGFNTLVLNSDNHFHGVDLNKFKNIKFEDSALRFDSPDHPVFFDIAINADAYRSNIGLWFCSVLTLFLIYLNLIYYGVSVYRPIKNVNIVNYNFNIAIVILSAILFQWLYLEDYIVYLESNKVTFNRFIEDSFYTLDTGAVIWPVQKLFAIHLLDFFYAVLALLIILVLSLFYKKTYVGYFILILLAMTLLYGYLDSKTTSMTIEMQTSQNNELKVYWSDENEQYQQNHSATLETKTDQLTYRLDIENLNNVHNIRIEPISTPGSARINKIEIIEPGYQPILINAANHFYAVDLNKKSKTTNKLSSEKLMIENEQLVFDTQTGDDFFEMIIEPKAFKLDHGLSAYLPVLALLCIIAGVLYVFHRHFRTGAPGLLVIMTRSGLLLILIMIMQLAWYSEYDAHPDERAHIESIDYYTQYWDPPKIGDARAISTYQAPWGFSRLDDLGVSYLLIGKFKNLLTAFLEDTVFTCRAFNSFLLIIVLALMRSKKFTLFCIPLLCLPQVWYLFSYANRDGFSFFLAVLLGWQFVNEKSYLNRYLDNKTQLKNIRNLLVPSLLLGVLSIEVSNYAIFILFGIAVLVWQGLLLKTNARQYFIKCVIFLLLATSVFCVRKIIDIDINGFNKQEQRTAFQEAIAEPEFKPSAASTEAGFFGLRLQQKGVSALDLFSPKWEWQTLTFKSLTGLYGNERTESSPEWYYDYVTYLYLLTGIVVLAAAIQSGRFALTSFSALTLVFVLGDVLMGFLYSWLYDFQPQGRYIFPLIPMLMMYFYKMAPAWGNKTQLIVASCAVLLFVLALYSFRSIALQYLLS